MSDIAHILSSASYFAGAAYHVGKGAEMAVTEHHITRGEQGTAGV